MESALHARPDCCSRQARFVDTRKRRTAACFRRRCPGADADTRNGSIDWLCWPRFDSDACFAALLGTSEHGRWLMAPRETRVHTSRRYRENTLILETRFETSDGLYVDLYRPGFTCTYDIPWDWAHRSPPPEPPFAPTARAPSCDQTITTVRC